MPNMAYEFGGLLVRCPLELYGLEVAARHVARNADISINVDVGTMPIRRPVTFDWKGRFQLTLEGGGSAGWTIRYRDEVAIQCDPRGRMLNCICRGEGQMEVLTEILLRRVLPRLTALHGRLPVHAAALDNGEGAVLIFGHSGVGKSTLTAAMAASGWDIMSDDMSILSLPGSQDARPQVWQTSPGVSLWEASRHALELPFDQCRAIEGYDGKYWFAPPCTARANPSTVGAIVFLSGAVANDIFWQRVTGPQALVMAGMQMVQFDPTNRTEGQTALVSFTRLVGQIPCYTLTYPRRYGVLPRVIETITALQSDARSRAHL
ncbi:MAG TPA: hypothetical protein VN137_01730 [Sphingomonas sp.]|nr:hypothetical protein [Sphingomonas sp.]